MTFLKKGYEVPEQPSNYMRLKEGDNIFRVLSSAITGWEWWLDVGSKRKPVRVKGQNDIPEDIARIQGRNAPRHFWAFVVWNWNKKQVQILEIKQRKIMTAIERLVANEKWGNPKEYDININRKGKELDTDYITQPEPKEEIDEGIVQMYKDMNIRLEALFETDEKKNDPFKDDVSDVPGDLK